jgi:hypothetical protein
VSPGAGILIALTTIMWRFPLFAHRTLFHGDSIVFGLPLFDLATREIWGGASTLWASGVYGGHPLFAEGQGAFANPLSFVVAALVSPAAGPVYGMNLFHFMCMLLSGFGMLKLAGSLGIKPWAAAFAALAVAFSPFWAGSQDNPAISGTLLWAPWTLWAFESWIARPTAKSAVLLAAAAAAMLLAGYPQGFHGAVLYMSARMLVLPFFPDGRRDWLRAWRARLTTGALAAMLCAGLAAIQLLPLLELVGLSHRSGGIKLEFQVPAGFYLRGILYTLTGVLDRVVAIPSVGSLLVCILASVVLFFNRSSRVAGHLVATLVLVQLGFGTASPFFRAVYEHHLLPGLAYFRATVLYLAIGTIGIGLLAAVTIDGLTEWIARRRAARMPTMQSPVVWGLAVMSILWAWGIERLHTPDAPWLEFATLFAALAGAVFLAWSGRPTLLPPLFAALLVVECAGLRLQPFRFVSAALIAKPASAKAIEATPGWRDFKVIDDSSAAVSSFLSSRSTGALPGFHRMLSANTGLTPVMWDLDSMDGALALPLTRREAIRPLIADEIAGGGEAPPGARMIDLLGIRFVSLDDQVQTPAFRPFRHESGAVWVMENTAARPRFQTFARHVAVASPEAAITMIRSLKAPALIIENPPGDGHQTEMPDAAPDLANDAGTPLSFDVLEADARSYRFDVQATRPGWLFVADANYPGWRATLDGKPTPLFTAQVLGKAVAIPEGRHLVAITFESVSFRLGAWISLASALIAAATLMSDQKKRAPRATLALRRFHPLSAHRRRWRNAS